MKTHFTEYSAAVQASETASATICSFDMSKYRNFDITVRLSSSSGMEYNVYGSPLGGSSVAVLMTACVNFSKACGTIRSTIRDHHLNRFWIEAASTAAGREVSASNIQVIVTAIKEEV